jgi:hypothetical protein
MATGRLGASDLSSGALTSVYTTPNLCNRGNQATSIRIAVADLATPTAGEYIEYDTEVLSKGVLERTGIVLAAGQIIVCYASGPNISAVAMGIETSTA